MHMRASGFFIGSRINADYVPWLFPIFNGMDAVRFPGPQVRSPAVEVDGQAENLLLPSTQGDEIGQEEDSGGCPNRATLESAAAHQGKGQSDSARLGQLLQDW